MALNLADCVFHPVGMAQGEVLLEIFGAVLAGRAIPAGEFSFLNVTERMIPAIYESDFGSHDEVRVLRGVDRSQ